MYNSRIPNIWSFAMLILFCLPTGMTASSKKKQGGCFSCMCSPFSNLFRKPKIFQYKKGNSTSDASPLCHPTLKRVTSFSSFHESLGKQVEDYIFYERGKVVDIFNEPSINEVSNTLSFSKRVVNNLYKIVSLCYLPDLTNTISEQNANSLVSYMCTSTVITLHKDVQNIIYLFFYGDEMFHQNYAFFRKQIKKRLHNFVIPYAIIPTISLKLFSLTFHRPFIYGEECVIRIGSIFLFIATDFSTKRKQKAFLQSIASEKLLFLDTLLSHHLNNEKWEAPMVMQTISSIIDFPYDLRSSMPQLNNI